MPTSSTVPKLWGTPQDPQTENTASSSTTAGYLGYLNQSDKNWLYIVWETFDFMHKIKDSNIGDKIISSLDVESLFVNVLLLNTINFMVWTTWENFGLPINSLCKLLHRCKFNIQFLHGGILSRKRDGVAMASPLGTLFAEAILAKLERTKLKSVIDSFERYHRSGDDMFCDWCYTSPILCANEIW